jgi:hypothetical protein
LDRRANQILGTVVFVVSRPGGEWSLGRYQTTETAE